jgi:hypothetical protein
MDNGEQGKKQNHSTFRSDEGGRKGNEEESCVWTKEWKAKSMYIVVVLFMFFSFCLPSTHFSSLFFHQKNTNLQSTYTHEQRAKSWKRKPRSKEGRKELKQWFFISSFSY